ncbi:MAG: hypothetical protein ACI8UR_001515 [Natronomonas sp.]|jgi:hypothetical protein|uniref:DUF7345 domain-containing protein n=1 Tax=Natronomonas sp. TaxID=2184060 RepID=UPI00398A2531
MQRRRVLTRVVGVLLCVALVSSMAAAPVAASEHTSEEFLVQLDAEGNADIAVTYTYDLETDSEQAAFDELRTNETAREEMATRFRNRMQSVADDAGNATGREMTVTDANVEVDSTDSVGIITLSVTWENLAAVDGEQLTVTEPFASGFEPNRTFTVEMPENYEVASVTPEPTTTGGGTASWEAGTSLSGFELVAEPTGEMGTGTSDGDGAGFGAAVAATALLGGALLARRGR